MATDVSEREQLRFEYYQLSAKEQRGMREGEYVEHKIAENRFKGFLLFTIVTALYAPILLYVLSFAGPRL